MSESGGAKAVVAALAANLAIAAMKFIAFAITRSSSMLAEGVHSLADSGNQVLLLIGGRRSRRPATSEHPFGYGADRYLYGFLVALVLFSVGGMFAVYEGVQKIRHPHELDSAYIAILVLIGAIVAESLSLRTGVRESNRVRGRLNWVQFVRRAKGPELPVVLLEDVAALTGLVLALFGVGLAILTGQAVWDGIGTLCIGFLLLGVAIVLIIETQSLLLGESAAEPVLAAVVGAIPGAGVQRIIHLRTLHLGPDELLVAAKIGMEPGMTIEGIAGAIDAAEARIRAAAPIARVIYLEPDLYRPDRAPVPSSAGGAHVEH